jgi:hypothetical protein
MDHDSAPDRSIDYLNQIAPRGKSSLFPSKLVMIGLGAALLVALLIIVIGSTNSKPDLTAQTTGLYARLQTLQTIASNEQNDLKDTQLRASNSSLTLLLNNSTRDIGSYLTGVNKKFKIPQGVQQSEKAYLENLTTKFTDARLNVDLDSTYAREMSYQLGVVHTTMNSIYRLKPSQSLSDILVTANNNLEPLRQTFANFSGAKE